MEKKYYGWILLGVFILIAGAFLASNRTKSPDVSSIPNQSTVAPIKIDLENDADFESDINDFDVDTEALEDFDSEDFDANMIDDNLF